MNQYQILRQRCLAESTRAFLARGKSVVRCEQCQLASYACICSWQPKLSLSVEFVLLMHSDEVFKPTNTGRLIADIFPAHTHAFIWSRTAPDTELLRLLNDPQRRCVIVFPAEEDAEENDTEECKAEVVAARKVFTSLPHDNKLTTFILLDGTWKQSGRMFNQGRWLDKFACVALPAGRARGYTVRKSHQENYLSTLEAAALCLTVVNEQAAANILLDYFELFNLHYLATRNCCAPAQGELHRRLALSDSVINAKNKVT